MKKVIFAATLPFFCMQLMAQFKSAGPKKIYANDPFCELINNKKIATEDVVYLAGYDKEMDDNIMWALTKFWKISKFKSADKNKYTYSKTLSYIVVDDYETKHDPKDLRNSTGDYYSTRFSLSNEKKGISGISYGFELTFDNVRARKEKDVIIGSDKTIKQMANKALLYTMMLCDAVKEFCVMPKELQAKQKGESNREYFVRYDQWLTLNKPSLKNTTLLVPKEILDNSITQAAFSGLKIKYKIEPLEQIIQRTKAGTDVKNYSALILVKRDRVDTYAYIIDLETAEILFAAGRDGDNMESKDFKITDKQLATLLEPTNIHWK